MKTIELLLDLAILFQFIFILDAETESVTERTILKDKSISLVSKNGNLNIPLSDLNDLFFEVIQPKDVSYAFKIRLAREFGSSFTKSYRRIELVIAEPFEACGSLNNHDKIKGKVVLISRGECSFLTKTITAEQSGAVAAIITDNDPSNENFIDMINDDTARQTNIPSAFLTWKDGYMIKKSLETNKLANAIVNIPLNLTLKNEVRYLKRAPWAFY